MMYNTAARRRTAHSHRYLYTTQPKKVYTSQHVVIPGPDSRKGRKGRKGDLRSPTRNRQWATHLNWNRGSQMRLGSIISISISVESAGGGWLSQPQGCSDWGDLQPSPGIGESWVSATAESLLLPTPKRGKCGTRHHSQEGKAPGPAPTRTLSQRRFRADRTTGGDG
ncbi:predicted protein [Histoplasma capsulatum G186AR]|uniref:Uncharacterized protein n=1 Tax=Ajellomyces capsulatus (strain G186AR / H82 / ATCC MYA-2454 / RMSCC 2432) TaxID=447093 RepID=C0NLH8_AJECG|nr:uncharacterized protein HCBG_04358 [Histoplasma capsulatum G186AR]EEH07479.1 predicted protein [Histoplasma capsulatum G186AR]